jgi:7-cyano-7-deazaguanine synthase in queuosine biosynthesis
MSNLLGEISELLSKHEKVVHLFSPGVDSFLAYSFMKKVGYTHKIKRVYFDLGGKYSSNEVMFLADYCIDNGSNNLEISTQLNMEEIELEDSYIPNRNITLVSMAAAKYQPDLIIINGMKDDRAPDQNRKLFDAFSEVLSMSLKKEITVTSFFWDYEKSQVVNSYLTELSSNRYQETLNSRSLAEQTFSCFHQELMLNFAPTYMFDGINYLHIDPIQLYGCRSCRACLRKLCVLTQANIFIPYMGEKSDIHSMLDSINKEVHPNRYNTVSNFLKFDNYLDTVNR